MEQRFVIEAVMLASYGQLLLPNRPVEYVVPYSTIMELYEMRDSSEPIMTTSEDERHVRNKMIELIDFLEEPLNRKKIEKAIAVPWRSSSPLLISDLVSMTVVHAIDNAQYGEMFDPIETEMVLIALKQQIPLLTDQFELQDRLIEHEIPVQIYDVEDFEFAMEGGIAREDLHI